MLNITAEFSTLYISGKVASMIGAPPRNPTHDTKVRSFIVNLLPIIQRNTTSGRATNIMIRLMPRPNQSPFRSPCGETSSPSIPNNVTCISQPMPS